MAIANELARQATRMPAERVDWKPAETAKSVLDIIRECAEVNERWARILKSREWEEHPVSYFIERQASFGGVQSACEKLVETAQAFCDMLMSLSESELEMPIALPWSNVSVALNSLHALWHMSYHEGQICYIQTLYGDMDED